MLNNDFDLVILSFPWKQFYIVSSDGFKNSLLLRGKGDRCLEVKKLSEIQVHQIRESYPNYMDQFKYSKNWDKEMFYKVLPTVTKWLMESFPAEEATPEEVEPLKWHE